MTKNKKLKSFFCLQKVYLLLHFLNYFLQIFRKCSLYYKKKVLLMNFSNLKKLKFDDKNLK